MARVMITCPKTRNPIYTGLNFDWFSFDSIEFCALPLHCPYCDDDHEWEKDEAYLMADGGEG
jgi:hypothetical protein